MYEGEWSAAGPVAAYIEDDNASRSAADLTCRWKDDSVVSFTVYDETHIVAPEGQVFRCLDGSRMLTPEIRSLDGRIHNPQSQIHNRRLRLCFSLTRAGPGCRLYRRVVWSRWR